MASARALKAVAPETVEVGKPKIILSGAAGVGKTTWAIQWPRPYVIDCEGGAVRPQYREAIKKAGGVYFGKEQGSQDFKTVIEEIITLATIKHDYSTLVIDSFSFIYNMARSIAEENGGSDFGRDKKEANKPTRQLMRWLEALDMSVILNCHQALKWERVNGQLANTGTTFDGFDKMEYALDLWLEATKDPTGKRILSIRKSRVESLPEGLRIPLEYGEFSKLYGNEVISRQSKPFEIATPEQIEEITRLETVMKLDEEIRRKWLTKAGADSWADMKQEDLQKCIDHLKKQITAPTTAKGGK